MMTKIEQIRQAITCSQVNTVSFDLFDTLIFRRSAKPEDAFRVLYHKLHLSEFCTEDEFVETRMYAEKFARAKAIEREVVLEDIYRFMPFSESLNGQIMAAELATEQSLRFIFEPVLTLITECINQGARVIFISDMYLTAEQIRQTFFSDHPQLQSIPLYVSGEIKKKKANGGMFRFLLDELALDPTSWLHAGDNSNADVKVPASFGLKTVHLSTDFDWQLIVKAEAQGFAGLCHSNATRFLAATHGPITANNGFMQVGAAIWGPALYAFCDWVIDNALAKNLTHILCLMRESMSFTPLLELRLAQRQISGIRVIPFYASRRSTSWPAIDTNQADWFDELLFLLSRRRGYTVANLLSDFGVSLPPNLSEQANTRLVDADRIYVGTENLLAIASTLAAQNKGYAKAKIEQAKKRFLRYVASLGDIELANCAVVDLGNGGTIQHNIQRALGTTVGANLLFYSTERIYARLPYTRYHSYIGAHNDRFNLRQLLGRSPECVESLLVGDAGSVYDYADSGEPILGRGTTENSEAFEAFMAGVTSFFTLHHGLVNTTPSDQEVVAILNRFVQLPTKTEATYYRNLYHEDNFGADKLYPIICDHQLAMLDEQGIEAFYLAMKKHTKYFIGEVHWPQALISIRSPKWLFYHHGVLSADTQSQAHELAELLSEKGWSSISIYGAGEFFQAILPLLRARRIQVDCVIDKRAEMQSDLHVDDFSITTLDEALLTGVSRLLICSYAYRREIVERVVQRAKVLNVPAVEMVSL